MDVGLLLLRLAVGGVIAAHGAQKLFGWFGGYGLEGTSGWLESLGFRPGRVQAAIAGWSEFLGGSLLILGFLTPLGAAAVIGVMIVAIGAVHWEKGFFNTAGGYEFNLVLLIAAAGLAFLGAGAASLDNALDIGASGMAWGVLALGLGALAGTTVLALRTPAGVQPTEEIPLEEERLIDLTEEERTRV